MLNIRFRNVLCRTLIVGAVLVSISTAQAGGAHFFGDPEQDDPALRAQANLRVDWTAREAPDPRHWIRFKILGINDFHGQLSGRTVGGRPAGGAAVLASYLKNAAAQAPDGAFIVNAGDHVGASPPNAALLQDEPAIGVLNLLTNQHCGTRPQERSNPWCNVVGTLGNHEFDEGVAELKRLLDGGNHPNGPFLEDPWGGARYPTIIANVVDNATGKTLLPPYVIKRIRGIGVGFVGAVLKETPTIVTPSGVAGTQFLDEADAINTQVQTLKRGGVRAIVVAMHQGTRQNSYLGPTQDDPQLLDGAIGDIVARLDDEVDVVVSGHAHSFTNTLMPNASGKLILVTQAFSAGTAYGDIELALDPRTRDVIHKSAAIVTTWGDEGPGLMPDAQVADLVARADARVAPLVNRVVGQAAADITRVESLAGESALGNLIADAQRAAMGTDIALMNPGGIRADIATGEVTWGELFSVQPFNNDLVRMTLTGTQIVALLDQQWAGQPFARIMKPSGLSYTWRENDPATFADNRVDPASILINGAPLDPSASYSVTVNSFMADGGDNFSVLTEGTNRVVGPVDLDALVDHIENLTQPFSAAIEGRIARAP